MKWPNSAYFWYFLFHFVVLSTDNPEMSVYALYKTSRSLVHSLANFLDVSMANQSLSLRALVLVALVKCMLCAQSITEPNDVIDDLMKMIVDSQVRN